MRFCIIIHLFIILHLKANILSFIYQTYRWKIIVHIYTGCPTKHDSMQDDLNDFLYNLLRLFVNLILEVNF